MEIAAELSRPSVVAAAFETPAAVEAALGKISVLVRTITALPRITEEGALVCGGEALANTLIISSIPEGTLVCDGEALAGTE